MLPAETSIRCEEETGPHAYLLSPLEEGKGPNQSSVPSYQVKTDKAPGIVNDVNGWGLEHGEPRYILDLVKRIVTVSVETMRIVQGLPELQEAE